MQTSQCHIASTLSWSLLSSYAPYIELDRKLDLWQGWPRTSILIFSLSFNIGVFFNCYIGHLSGNCIMLFTLSCFKTG